MIASRSMFLVLCFLGERPPQELPRSLGAELRVRGQCRAPSSAARGPREGVRQPNSSACHLFFQVAKEHPFLLVEGELVRRNPPPTSSYPSPSRPATKRARNRGNRTSGGKTLALPKARASRRFAELKRREPRCWIVIASLIFAALRISFAEPIQKRVAPWEALSHT